MTALRLARVVAVHPERRRLDLVFHDDGSRAGDVRVATRSASSDAGSWDVPSVPPPDSEPGAAGIASSGRSMTAVCAMLSGHPVVIGFLDLQGGQVAFAQQDREVHRHASGAYTTFAPDGSIEAYHPGGAYLRIGSGDHEDLTPLAAAGNWRLPAGAAAPTITLSTNGFKLVAQPGGAGMTLTVTGPCSITVSGNATVNAGGNAVINATGNASLTAGGQVNLGTASGGKRVVVDGDRCSDGATVIASQVRVLAG